MMNIEDLKQTVDDTIGYIKGKYPEEAKNNTMDKWLALIGEEFGELCMAINDADINNVIEEGTQVCATTLCMLEAFCNKNKEANYTVSDSIRKKPSGFRVTDTQIMELCKNLFV